MLIDNWTRLAAVSRGICPTATNLIELHRHNAQRFQFTEEATRASAALVRDYPNILVHNLQFAVPPYETTYIEYPAIAWATEFGINRYMGQSTDKMDTEAGHFIHRNTVATVAASSKLGSRLAQGAIAPWLYTIDWFSELQVPDSTLRRYNAHLVRLKGKQDEHIPMTAQVLGSTLHDDKSGITDEIVEHIHNNIHLWYENTVYPGQVLDTLHMYVGELRNLFQMILFIQQPQHLIFDEIAASRQMVGNRSVVTPRYRLVRIKPKTTVHHISRTFRERMKVGLHEVRAFWRNFDKSDSCVHEWPLMPNDLGQFHCARCSQWRVRVKSHMRGDPMHPVARKGYKV